MVSKNIFTAIGICIGLALCIGLATNCSGGGDLNTTYDVRFTADGHLAPDSTATQFQRELPSSVKFYVEVSGSMNGFFRKNVPTEFKTDVWNILSVFSQIAPEITILTNDGSQGASLPLDKFRTDMNTGSFVSSASTKVPLMLQTIIDNLNADDGEVAVLISDMKYSPVGSAAPAVLMAQYATDINKIIGQFGKSISIICATSNYVDKSGKEVTSRSPYYYAILGNQEKVAEMRNYLSLLLNRSGNLVDNIESGFNYGHPEYSFGIPKNCIQLGSEPTFYGADEDSCVIRLKVPLENYRWLMANEEVFRNALTAKALYGSNLEIGDIKIDEKDIKGASKILEREAVATVDLKISNMPLDSDVIEWNLELPVTNCILFNEFFKDAVDENDPTKSYSVPDFLKGVFQGGVATHDMQPNYILISKND